MTYIDTTELAVRIGEACMSNERPRGMTAIQAMESIRSLSAESALGFERAALAAAEYIAECVNAANPGQVEIKRVMVNDGGVQ